MAWHGGSGMRLHACMVNFIEGSTLYVCMASGVGYLFVRDGMELKGGLLLVGSEVRK